MATVPSTNVNLATNIRDVLNAAGGTVSNAIVTFFQSVAKLNPWARYKPIRYAKDFAITNAQRKSVNYGLTIPSYTYAEVTANTIKNWSYALPTGGSSQPYRLDDFCNNENRASPGYNTEAQPPILFSFADLTNSYVYNTVYQGTLPYVRVRYRLNDNVQSAGLSNAEIPMGDLNISGITTGSIGDYLASVTNGSLIANSADTLGLKFGTSVNDMVINLEDFTVENAFTTDTTGYSYPADATNKQILTLYPRINKFTPSVKGGVFNNNGAPGTSKGSNGYFAVQDNPFISIPIGTPLYVRRYTKVPIKSNYAYYNIIAGSTTFINTWGFVATSSSYTTGIQNMGGKTLNFASQTIEVQCQITLVNVEATAAQCRLAAFTPGDIFGRCTNVLMRTAATSGNISSITVPAGGSVNLFIIAIYTAGSKANYTFPTITSPSYGTQRAGSEWEVMGTNGWGSSFAINEVSPEEIRWR